MKRSKHDLTHAKHDPAHCLAPGLFRSLKRGERKKTKLDVTYQYGTDQAIRFIGFEPLGADDMRLLQGIVALAGPNGILLTPETDDQTGKQLRLFMEPKWEAVEQDVLVVRESLTKLLSETGITDGGDNIKALKASLTRMSNVTVIVRQGQQQASFHLMSHAIDADTGRLLIALNPRVTEAILGDRPHARIAMSEVRALESDPARLIHQRLCGWIDPGKSGRISLESICGYVWPTEATGSTMRMRRKVVREALAELERLGWTVDEYAKGKFQIGRANTEVP